MYVESFQKFSFLHTSVDHGVACKVSRSLIDQKYLKHNVQDINYQRSAFQFDCSVKEGYLRFQDVYRRCNHLIPAKILDQNVVLSFSIPLGET